MRIWVAGCATGEEAYSVAIMLHEGLSNAGKPINVKIFATDVHRASLDYAGTGIYSEEALADVEPELLSRYFNKQKDGYHVIPDLRQMIVFATHNVMCDAPFTKLDLITCRNLLIYFQTTAQKKALSLFHFGLKTGGWLFLGPSESPNELLDELDVVDMHWKLYRKSRDVRLPNDMDLPLGKTLRPIRSRFSTAPVTATGQPDLTLVAAYDEMLEKFMPPGILINDKRELLHTFGGAEKYLKVASGRPSSDVLSLFDRELRNAVTGAVQRALRDNSSVSYTGIRRQNGPAEQKLRVTVDPLENRRSQSTQLLIRIDEIEPASTTPRENGEKRVDKDMRQMTADRIEDLEDELRYSKENLQATIEELETSNEEMQATNEELVASNEELQSTNEELQSVNEELYTVNAEYQKKIAELSQLTSDMDNLLESTDVGTIFLDRELNIRKFTPQIGAKFHLLPQDLGRPISSFSHNLMHPDLMDDLASVVLSEQPFEREVQDSQGKWSYLRILPYLTKGKQVDGVVMTVIDITQVKHAQEQLAMAVRRRDEFLAMLSHELRNPLGAILNATHVIDRVDVNNDVVLDAFKVVRRQGRQMSRLLDDLLDVSRVTHNKIELHMKPVDVSAIVENAIDAVKPMIDAGGLTLTTEIADQQLIVFGDESRLQQALSNLLANAARYTPVEGEVKLIATSESEEVILRVIDNGMGIPAEDLDSIFELFVQSDRSLHRAQSGMGIGLTLVRSIVEMHDGEVTVTSEGLGRGSCFEIRIPSYNPKFDESVKEPQSQEDTSTLFSGGRVVLVEDQQDARLMLRRLLELEGYEVHVADNGTKGLTAIERIRPEVALIDIGLPGIDGYELARQLRQNLGNNHTYLVALTGYGQQDDVEAAMNAGFDDHLVKPLDLEKLSKILKLHSRRSTEVNESV
ncbi:MAG: CheR family methyltransferase [Planctomycetaceae bacterium]